MGSQKNKEDNIKTADTVTFNKMNKCGIFPFISVWGMGRVIVNNKVAPNDLLTVHQGPSKARNQQCQMSHEGGRPHRRDRVGDGMVTQSSGAGHRLHKRFIPTSG